MSHEKYPFPHSNSSPHPHPFTRPRAHSPRLGRRQELLTRRNPSSPGPRRCTGGRGSGCERSSGRPAAPSRWGSRTLHPGPASPQPEVAPVTDPRAESNAASSSMLILLPLHCDFTRKKQHLFDFCLICPLKLGAVLLFLAL